MTDERNPGMGEYDDEPAALLALDALTPDEQVEAELRLGPWPMPLAEATLPLAEAVASEPPPDLRSDVLAAALARRPAGRPVPAVRAVTPAEAFERTLDEFHDLLLSLSEAEASRSAHEEHGRVRDLVAHLAGVERLNLRWLDPDGDAPYLPDHVAATRATVAELADLPFAEVVARWHAAALAMLAAARRGDQDRQVPFHDIAVTVGGMLTMRTFELWAHGMDIALATDRPLLDLDDERMRLMSSRLMDALPLALAYRGVEPPGRTVRFVLTGPGGGCYDVPLDGAAAATDPDVLVVTDVVALCRVAAARLGPDRLDVTVEGDRELADLVLAHVDAFARD
ncbi:maleylpyruvate isomerase family mycothiol-dependent enzyme [Nocardioides aquiterrae]|uniref:Mycothiol-dependent maleylpyruvate isomerase metal-binding domain-containing protein n=1 Tax=Nocardioides aquiterrae TaxID=203799 RepID=A0ABP4FFW4_9ACTN